MGEGRVGSEGGGGGGKTLGKRVGGSSVTAPPRKPPFKIPPGKSHAQRPQQYRRGLSPALPHPELPPLACVKFVQLPGP
jgi:hypothetical protein